MKKTNQRLFYPQKVKRQLFVAQALINNVKL